MGAIELSTMKVVSARPEQVNSDTTVAFFEQLKTAYPDAQKIHTILDNSGYHCSQRVKDAALEKGIMLHYLPPYSPNLNPIERLWKVMNEQVRNNRFFSSAKEFRDAIAESFDSTLAKIAPFLRGRINDNFQTFHPVPSSWMGINETTQKPAFCSNSSPAVMSVLAWLSPPISHSVLGKRFSATS